MHQNGKVDESGQSTTAIVASSPAISSASPSPSSSSGSSSTDIINSMHGASATSASIVSSSVLSSTPITTTTNLNNNGTHISSRFSSNTFPLVSRSSIKRPLSLTHERGDYCCSNNNGDCNNNSAGSDGRDNSMIIKDYLYHSHHNNHHHHRYRGGMTTVTGQVGFRSRAKTIHSSDSRYSSFQNREIFGHFSAIFDHQSSSTSTEEYRQNRQTFRNMEFRKKTRKSDSNQSISDAEEKKTSVTATKSSKSKKLTEQILEEEMIDPNNDVDDGMMTLFEDEDEEEETCDISQPQKQSGKFCTNSSDLRQKKFDGILPDPTNPFYKFMSRKAPCDNKMGRKQQTDGDKRNGFDFETAFDQSNQYDFSPPEELEFWDQTSENTSHNDEKWSINDKWTQNSSTATSSTSSLFSSKDFVLNENNNSNNIEDQEERNNDDIKADEEVETITSMTIKASSSSSSIETTRTSSSFKATISSSPAINITTAHIPTVAEKEQFQRSLNSATTLVFHRRSGLPLTSSPAPIRKSGTCFDFDSSLTSVNAIKKALFHKDPDGKDSIPIRSKLSLSAPTTTTGLLGNFEESVLNGRLDPASIVHGFTAEIGASGGFCPSHKTFPVTVFFYTLQDTDKGEKMSSPYLGHINLGEKGYHVPRQGTVQVTLFNPNGTVVKMFVVRYDLSDMPPNSRTFLRQRTLFMPSDANEHHPENRKWLRYLIHLRFQSSKSGRIRLHTDIRILVFRKHDLDVATMNGGAPYELRSFVQMPSNPKYSKNIKT